MIAQQAFRFTSLVFIFSLLYSLAYAQLPSASGPIENAGRPMTALERHIHGLCQEVVDNNKTTDRLSEEDLADLPIGIVREIGNNVYVIAIDSAYWNGQGWYFSAYASIKLPNSTRPIAFRARDIAFNKSGLASLSAKLVLVSAPWIQISDDLVLELPANGRNYINFDCDGFKDINLSGNFIFTKYIIPVYNTTPPSNTLPSNTPPSNTLPSNTPPVLTIDTTNYVVANFEVNTADLSNIMASVNIAPFKIKGLDEVSFAIKNAVVDLSDMVNPPGFTFPPDYQQSFGESPTLWRGFYLEELTIIVNGFSKPLTLQGHHMLIDDMGISGSITASNLLSIQEGSADGWPLSVNTLSLHLLHNHLTGGAMAGNIIIPFLGTNSLAYAAELEQTAHGIDYKFSVATTEDQEFDTPFFAKITLEEGSTLSFEKANGTFIPAALLHGSITVQHNKMQAAGIHFQNLKLTSQHPYLISGEFSTVGNGQSSTSGFPVKIDDIILRIMNGNASLGFAVALNFMNTGDKGFSVKTNVTVTAKLETVPPAEYEAGKPAQQVWKYDGIDISDIMLNCNTTAFTMQGRLTLFDDDPEFGTGFRGSLNIAIPKVLPREIQVNAYFGSKDAFRYWYFDAYIPTVAIPLVPPVSINGFIGGAAYKMTARNQSFTPDFTQLNTTTPAPSNRAEPAYVPDASAGLSFKAGVTLIAGNEKAFNADAILEIAFNATGGIRYVQFKGSGYFLTSMESRGRPSEGPQMVQAPVFADLNILYDQDNNVFHANLKAYMNLENTIRGTGPNNMIGEAVIHVDSHDWYIYIGRPSSMLGVDIANLAVGHAYFMAGTQLENLPPPPDEVRSIMEERDLSLVRDENTLALGRGLALGARFQTGFDSKDKIRPFYAIFTAGGGADVMIRDFGNATCNGSSDRIGFDGWYASGQAYMFLRGKVGIKVKGKKFDFLSLGAAALLQAKLPNPTWLKGQIAGRYSVLGGLVSGKFNVKVIMGEECEITTPGSELGDILVIADLTPDAGAKEVSVFTSPQVSFNTAIDSELSMLNNQDELNTYRIRLDEFNVSHDGQTVRATHEWNSKKDVLALRTAEILPPQTSLTAFVKVHWEKKLSNGSWEPLKENNQVDYETKTAIFNTGDAPDFIPDENVAYTYPVKQQYNFLINEYGQGYVKLKIGQSYLFQPAADGSQWTFLARFQVPAGAVTETPLNYNSAQSTVTFAIPEALTTQTVYKLTFIKRPQGASSIDANVKRERVDKDAGEGNEVTLASNTLEGTITQELDKEIYNSAFRTSKFKTFHDKWATLSATQDMFDVAIGNIAVIGKSATLQETFDDFELKGVPHRHNPLVQVSASPENDWMKNTIVPMLYELYPVHQAITITHRNTDSLGIKPLRAMMLTNIQENYRLEESSLSSGITVPKSGPIRIMYYLSFVSFQDYKELRNKAAGLVINGSRSPGMTRLLSATEYTDLKSGYYPVDIRYTLPGTNQVTTHKQITIQF